jgi:hypothetical protein
MRAMWGWWKLIGLAVALITAGAIDKWIVAYVWPELYYPDVCTGAFILGFVFLWGGAHFERMDMQDQKRMDAAAVEYADWNQSSAGP